MMEQNPQSPKMMTKGRPTATLRRGRPRLTALAPILFIGPAALLFVLFVYWPMCYTVYLSFLDWNLVSPVADFVGWANYRQLLFEPIFWVATKNTLLYLAVLLPVELCFPLALALLLQSLAHRRLRTLYESLIFSPTVLSFGIASIVWVWMFNPLGGALGRLFRMVGLPAIPWLNDSATSLWAIVLVSAWKVFGYNLLIFLAALANIPGEYLEAARIDGASPWTAFRWVTWPLLGPTTFFVLITTAIFTGTQVFIPIHVLTQGGPYNSSTHLMYLIYQYGFQFFQIGPASAASVITFLGFMLLTFLQVKYVERFVHYAR
jgi:sn-glycerol 3-phosphate transport system permease protein